MSPNGDINYLFAEVFRRLTLVLENTKNHKNREQIQLVIEGVSAIKKEVKKVDRTEDK